MLLGGAAIAALSAQGGAAQEVEVLHWWTSPGEAAAVNVMKEKLQARGIAWLDAPIAGGGGQAAMTALRARVVAGDAPTAAMVLGYDIKDWAELGLLGDISAAAGAGDWAANYPEPYQFFGMHDGQWVATPFDVHSTNWLWVNKEVFDGLAVAEPRTWDEMIAMFDAARGAGVIPLAHGGQPWQDTVLFGNVVMATGGPDFFRSAILEQDKEALGSDTMRRALERFVQLGDYMDPNSPGRDWNLASAMVIQGEALAQSMGDWAKGEFVAAGKVAGEDYLCLRFPGTGDQVAFLANSFVFFDVAEDMREAQITFAGLLMSPEFQEPWSVLKGSVPAHLGASDERLDTCGKKAFQEYKSAAASGTLSASIMLHSAPAAVRGAVEDVVSQLLIGRIDIDAALEGLRASADAAR